MTPTHDPRDPLGPAGMRRVVILGGACAGLTAAIYAARANLQPLVIEGAEAGGQLMLTTLVENFPGFPEGIMGPDLMQAMRAQAERVGAAFITEDAVEADFSHRPFRIRTQSGEEVRGRPVIVATGARAGRGTARWKRRSTWPTWPAPWRWSTGGTSSAPARSCRSAPSPTPRSTSSGTPRSQTSSATAR